MKTFRDIASKRLESAGPRTRIILGIASDYFGDKPAEFIDSDSLDAFRRARLKKVSEGTANKEARTVQLILGL